MFPEKNDKYGFIKAMHYIPSMQLVLMTHCNMPVMWFLHYAAVNTYKQS